MYGVARDEMDPPGSRMRMNPRLTPPTALSEAHAIAHQGRNGVFGGVARGKNNPDYKYTSEASMDHKTGHCGIDYLGPLDAPLISPPPYRIIPSPLTIVTIPI